MPTAPGPATDGTATEPQNVLGDALQPCSQDPVTGFYRSGACETGPQDLGAHVVCAQMTEDFLRFTKRQGNDLSSPRPRMGFPGLDPGDQWCLCAARWQEALDLEDLRSHAVEAE
ncbi:MAG: DUF2237 domain-containing protein [Bacteroidetes bacterium QS_9_68_14]|nr:MAG: DUF2237 domain-containing protein [Bacteroidetes bacterium QS_9_68_14]